jgi:cellulose synthase/poly-beta-1,6-N-acetylglucosamine synthase-like glycosyltransferase
LAFPLEAVSLEQAFDRASPRRQRISTPWPSLLIHGGVMLLWVALFLRAFAGGGLFAWSAGIVYVGYDTVLLAFVFWQTLKLLRPRRPAVAAAGMARRSLGVIIAAHNEAAVLPATIAALYAQSEPPDEIIIADDGSSDGTAACLSGYFGGATPAPGQISDPAASHPGLRWLRLPHGGKARALNAAVLHAQTDVVLTVDADTVLDADALGEMRNAFSADPSLVAATGVLVPVCAPGVSGRLFQWFQTYEYIRNFLSRYAWMQLDCLLLISGAFAGFDKRALLEVGGFDTSCLVEDYELIHRLRRYAEAHGEDWRTAVVGRAVGRTDAPADVGAFLRQRRRWFGGFLQTQLWYRDMVGSRRYGWLGLAMLPVKAFDTMQPVYGLGAFLLLMVFLFTGQFAVVFPVAGVMGAKIGIDLSFHLWSVHLYRRWLGRSGGGRLGMAFCAAIAEPFTFQLFRHLGAALGWVVFLRGQASWGTRRRQAMVPLEEAAWSGRQR